jgi:hypothetical protein
MGVEEGDTDVRMRRGSFENFQISTSLTLTRIVKEKHCPKNIWAA